MKIFNLTPEEKKIHNEKVDRRRKTIKKILKKTGSGLKKTWKYLGETRLAQGNKNTKDKPKPKQHEEKKQPRRQTNVTNVYINMDKKQQQKEKKQTRKQTQSSSKFKDIDWFNPRG